METAPGKVPRVVDWRLEPVQIPVSMLPAFQAVGAPPPPPSKFWAVHNHMA
jgi:hypothetical protein